MAEVTVGIDIRTTSVKALAADGDGNVTSSVQRLADLSRRSLPWSRVRAGTQGRRRHGHDRYAGLKR